MDCHNAKTAPELSVGERKDRLAALVKEGKISQAAADKIEFCEAPAGVDEFGRSLNEAAGEAWARGQREAA